MSLVGVHDAFARRFANLTACTVNYNTPELLEALVESIRKNSPSISRIVVFDNSDKSPFYATTEKDGLKIEVIDNSNDKVVDYGSVKAFNGESIRGGSYGSAMHSMAIQYLIENVGPGFILLDSDVLVKKDLSPIFDDRCVFKGSIGISSKRFSKLRVEPYCSYLNSSMIRKLGIRYHSNKHIIGLTKRCRYDTGAFFYEQCMATSLRWEKIDPQEYVVHLKGATWMSREDRISYFLQANKCLYA